MTASSHAARQASDRFWFSGTASLVETGHSSYFGAASFLASKAPSGARRVTRAAHDDDPDRAAAPDLLHLRATGMAQGRGTQGVGHWPGRRQDGDADRRLTATAPAPAWHRVSERGRRG